MGRDTKWSQHLQNQFIESYRIGTPLKVAAEGVGISEATVYNWVRKGEDGKKPYVKFLQALQKAKKDLVDFHVGQVTKASRAGTWQASAWMLERKLPEEFGRTIQEHRGTVTNQYLIALRIAGDEKAIVKVHDAIRGSANALLNPGGNGNGHQ